MLASWTPLIQLSWPHSLPATLVASGSSRRSLTGLLSPSTNGPLVRPTMMRKTRMAVLPNKRLKLAAPGSWGNLSIVTNQASARRSLSAIR